MSFYAYLSIAIAVIFFFLGNFVLFLEKKKLLNRLFFLMCAVLSWWSFVEFLRRFPIDPAFAYPAARMAWIWPLGYAFSLHFVLVFIEKKAWLKKPLAYGLIYGPAAFFVGVELFSNILVGTLRREFWGYTNTLEASAILICAVTWMNAVTLAETVLVIRYMKTGTRVRKRRAKHVLTGLLLVFAGALIQLAVAAMNLKVPETTSLFSLGMAICFAYAIVRYELFTVSPALAADNIVATMPDALFLADPDGIIITLNKAMTRLTRFTDRELVGSHARVLFDVPEEGDSLISCLLSGANLYSQEEKLARKNDHPVTVSFSGTLVKNMAGDPIGILGLATDISTRKHMEEELRRSNRELEQFAYVASHDLQEPLRMVTSYVQLIARRYKCKLDKDADDFINFAVDGAARMKMLIDGLLEFSRVGTRGKPFEKVDINEVLLQVTENLRIALTEKKAVVAWDTLPAAEGDPVQLARLFQNLIGNALKFQRAGEQPKITITARGERHSVVFSVSDNGIGIEPAYFDKIFEMFQRLHSQKEYPGTGIGLSVCKRIVERHNGRIWLDSTPGGGTTFHFTLPAA